MQPSDLLPPEITQEDPILDFTAQLEEAAHLLDLEDWIVQRLKHPEREITLNLPLLRDLGDSLTCTAYRVQHLRARAGCLGPVVLAPDAHIAQLRPRALRLTLQCALLDVPLGGSAGAIVCEPGQLSERELRHLVRDYRAALHDLAGEIFAPADFSPAWTSRHLDPVAVVGKPVALGGLPEAPAAIAAGWLTLIEEGLATRKLSAPNCRVALQGFGAAAAALAKGLHRAGARIIALADKSGGLLAERGLDLAAIAAHVAAHGMIYGYDAAESVSNADVLESACDLLIVAGAESQLNLQNAARIRAPLVLDAIPNAVTPSAMRALTSRGITVVPALLGAAPATLAWVAEWQHSLCCSAPGQEAIESHIRRKLREVFHSLHAAALAHDCALADACLPCALQKLAATLRLTR